MDDQTKSYMAYGATGVGVINLCAWLLPICGGPLGIVGIILGVIGLQTEQRTFAIVGIALSVIGLCAAIGNGAYGAYIAIEAAGGF